MIDEAAARRLLRDYANAIDRGELGRWPEFFTERATYRITTRDNHERGMPLSIWLCSNRAMLYDRLEAIERANVFEPHRYRHILSDSELVQASGEEARLRTSFICVRIMDHGDTMLFVSGEYVDRIVREEGSGLRFAERTVVLDQSRVDTLIALPL